ncbi:MAG: hypothetical protein K8W52_10005 [Deltaproteobacteria bacterium]|nr:hypothetical protein [Deltaproteobacteria bacterium]
MSASAFLLALAACHPKAAPTPPPTTPPPGVVTAELAPAPFTADELRQGSPVGRVMRYHVTTGSAGMTIEYRFIAADAVNATIRTTETPDGGGAGTTSDDVAAWADLAHHADSPAAATVIRDAEITVPAGTFPCKEYVVTATDGGVTRVTTSDFAVAMPGPPIKMTVTANGALETTLELVAYEGLVP